MLNASIEGKTYSLQFDLGSKFLLSLNKNVLEAINDKKSFGMAKWQDVKGNFYEEPSYSIPRVKIGNLVLTQIVARQENDAFRTGATIWKSVQNSTCKHVGCLGRPLLEQTNFLLDLKNSQMIACNSKRRLQKMGFVLDNMTKIPFEGGSKGIIINFETDIGMLRLGLDTGSTITLVRTCRLQDQNCTKDARGFPVFTTQKFSAGNKDFGAKDLYLYEITPELKEIDGMLGMDFLENHIIYIDYKGKFVYIGNYNS